jgi:hypothetical protein
LSISLHGSLRFHSTILPQYAEQLKYLEIHEEELHDGFLTDVGSLSCLETLTIGALWDENEEMEAFPLSQTLALLRLAPNLVKCSFRDVPIHVDNANEEKLALPSLRYLTFSTDHKILRSDDEILRHLSLPALETLFLPFSDISCPEFSQFLERSLPPLQKLVAGDEYIPLEYRELDRCLRLVPSLTYLELYVLENIFLDGFFSALADFPSDLLPNLRTLKIQHNSRSTPPESSYQMLLRALSVRRTQLLCVAIINQYDDQAKPGPDVCAGLRELAAEGMEIHIGHEGHNFITA